MTQPNLFAVAPATVRLTPMTRELKRREGNYRLVLERLTRGPATNHELAALAGYRFGARIYELKRDGAEIERVQTDESTHVYTMTKGPTT